jgi:hypothetical protein
MFSKIGGVDKEKIQRKATSIRRYGFCLMYRRNKDISATPIRKKNKRKHTVTTNQFGNMKKFRDSKSMAQKLKIKRKQINFKKMGLAK